ncbi:MAG: DUF2784 domain-containing protein [Candidatus Thiodiazotropha sp. (ex Lucinoma borealis)]|nr:DUF2784 domain-containing protein [Candidatus Thiodiazotropha sp. (ex Lucinoma borealis)]
MTKAPAESIYLLAADAIIVAHVLFVAFVVLGVLAIYAGYLLSWTWVRNYWFRLIHLVGIVFVVLESWVGIICPLTTWEMHLREKAGGETYSGSFIQHWLHSILYYEAPEWVFVIVYTLFGALVLASWFIVPPRRHE